MTDQITLEIEDREGNRRTETFDKDNVTIGVNPDNDIVVTRKEKYPGNTAFPNTARRHGLITIDDGKLFLQDAGTSNGWHCLNGINIQPYFHPLEIGDQYYVGNSKITILSFTAESKE